MVNKTKMYTFKMLELQIDLLGVAIKIIESSVIFYSTKQ